MLAMTHEGYRQAQLEATGLHLTELLGGAGEETAACAECGERVRLLFHVRCGTRQGDRVVDAADERRAWRGGGEPGPGWRRRGGGQHAQRWRACTPRAVCTFAWAARRA